MKVTGGCHCGQLAYEAEVDPEKSLICHCSDCQTLSGTAFRTVVFTRMGTFRVLKGTIKDYVKTAESGNPRLQGFCPDCGTPIYAAPPGEDYEKVHFLRTGSIHQRDALAPKLQVWCRSRQSWLPGMDDLPGLDTQPALNAAGTVD